MESVYFLCGNFNGENFIFAIRSRLSDWYYFDEQDSLFDVHVSLPQTLSDEISRLNKLKEIAWSLNGDQIATYVKDGKFFFKGEELKTSIELSGISANQIDHHGIEQSNPRKKEKSEATHNLVFEFGKTNPAIFLKTFEKCSDVKTEKDKIHKLRNFVNENDKKEFSALFFKGDWQRARSTFLRKYSMEFTRNKKKELDLRFENDGSLRSFVGKKMDAMTTYTNLSFENQLEIILSELPNEIANVFIVEDKLSCKKDEILDFCDVIQDFCESANIEESVPGTDSEVPMPSDVVQELEIFNYTEGIESSDTESTSTNSSGRGKVRKITRGPPAKRLRTISEDIETSSDSDSNQTITITCSQSSD